MSSSTRSCPVCDGTARLLGCLGSRRHYRCMDCGTDFSHAPKRTATKASRVFADAVKNPDVALDLE